MSRIGPKGRVRLIFFAMERPCAYAPNMGYPSARSVMLDAGYFGHFGHFGHLGLSGGGPGERGGSLMGLFRWFRAFWGAGGPESSSIGAAPPLCTRSLEANARFTDGHPDGSADEGLQPAFEPISMPIEDSIDLHTFAPRDVRSVVQEYLVEAHSLGFSEVRVIHGRGKGVQRRIVQSLLARHPLVEIYGDAPPHRGGWGATLVRLTPSEGTSPVDRIPDPERSP